MPSGLTRRFFQCMPKARQTGGLRRLQDAGYKKREAPRRWQDTGAIYASVHALVPFTAGLSPAPGSLAEAASVFRLDGLGGQRTVLPRTDPGGPSRAWTGRV